MHYNELHRTSRCPAHSVQWTWSIIIPQITEQVLHFHRWRRQARLPWRKKVDLHDRELWRGVAGVWTDSRLSVRGRQSYWNVKRQTTVNGTRVSVFLKSWGFCTVPLTTKFGSLFSVPICVCIFSALDPADVGEYPSLPCVPFFNLLTFITDSSVSFLSLF